MNSEEETTSCLPSTFGTINWEEYESLAGVGFSPEKIAMYFEINEDEFMYYFLQEGSPLKYKYNRGLLIHQGKEAIVTLQSAQGGNATQAQRLDKIRRTIDFEEHKKRIIYGE